MLPDDKNDFPKLLYLDQNKWIDIARAHYGRDGGSPFEEVLAAVSASVANGKLIVPISGVHVLETMAVADEGRRQRMAEFMVEISKNTTILPHMTIRPVEILYAVLRRLGRQPTQSIRGQIIKAGLSYALGAEIQLKGIPDAAKEALMRELSSPETSIKLLVEAANRAVVEQTRKEDIDTVAVLEDVRHRAQAVLSDEERLRVELAELFTKGPPGAELRQILKNLDVESGAFFDGFGAPDKLVEFFKNVSTVDVFVTLGLARDRDAQRPIHRNDTKDMGFLSVAVPYANIIVAERYWVHKVKNTGLAAKYETFVETDMTQLPDLLRAAGCL